MAITEVKLANRRRVPRRSFDSVVGLLLHGRYRLERSFQVGEGGMMIASEEEMQEGTHLTVSFFLPGSVLVIVRGVIRSVVPAGRDLPVRYGIEFINLEFQFKRLIRNFVAAATRTDGQINGER